MPGDRLYTGGEKDAPPSQTSPMKIRGDLCGRFRQYDGRSYRKFGCGGHIQHGSKAVEAEAPVPTKSLDARDAPGTCPSDNRMGGHSEQRGNFDWREELIGFILVDHWRPFCPA